MLSCGSRQDFKRLEVRRCHRARHNAVRQELHRRDRRSRGVKLEEQTLVTETGTELLSNYQFEANMFS